jgi:glycine dehydrogenase subunit 2
MIEPTETESKETLEAFAEAMIEIDSKIEFENELLTNGPYKAPVRRLDETKANRELDLRWTP